MKSADVAGVEMTTRHFDGVDIAANLFCHHSSIAN